MLHWRHAAKFTDLQAAHLTDSTVAQGSTSSLWCTACPESLMPSRGPPEAPATASLAAVTRLSPVSGVLTFTPVACLQIRDIGSGNFGVAK